MDPARQPTPLGLFGRLPGEVRQKIYRELVNQCSATALTRTSQAIHNEVNYYQYDDFEFTFDIRPSDDFPAVSICNREGSPWASDPDDQEYILRTGRLYTIPYYTGPFPFEKFKTVNTNIHCPDAKDPGQLIKGWHQVTRLLDWVLPEWPRYQSALPDMRGILPARCNTSLNLPEVHLRYVGAGWATAGGTKGFQHSIIGPMADRLSRDDSPSVYEKGFRDSDLEVLLLPFRRMRRARSFTVQLPSTVVALQDTFLHTMLSEVTTLACSHTAFGLDRISDWAIRTEETMWHVWLECRLADAQGSTAAQLRQAIPLYTEGGRPNAIRASIQRRYLNTLYNLTRSGADLVPNFTDIRDPQLTMVDMLWNNRLVILSIPQSDPLVAPAEAPF